jgi:hypothetical protein
MEKETLRRFSDLCGNSFNFINDIGEHDFRET